MTRDELEGLDWEEHEIKSPTRGTMKRLLGDTWYGVTLIFVSVLALIALTIWRRDES